jgi:hypothetical protein
MNGSQIAHRQNDLPIFSSPNDFVPMGHCYGLSTPHGRGVLSPDAQDTSDSGRSTEGGEEFVDGADFSHDTHATQRIVIRQGASKRMMWNSSRMKNDSKDRLERARIAAGFETPTDAARAFGWNEVTYRSHEAGGRNILPQVAERYARAFKVSAGWLLTGEGPEQRTRLSASPMQERHAAPPASGGARVSPAMSDVAQAAVEALLIELGMREDQATRALGIILEAAEELPIPGVDRSLQARVSAVSKLRGQGEPSK